MIIFFLCFLAFVTKIISQLITESSTDFDLSLFFSAFFHEILGFLFFSIFKFNKIIIIQFRSGHGKCIFCEFSLSRKCNITKVMDNLSGAQITISRNSLRKAGLPRYYSEDRSCTSPCR